MRLLKIGEGGELSLTSDLVEDHEIPRYAILSHTWRQDSDEVTFEDLQNGFGKRKAGYDKIRFCKKQAEKDELQYLWVDTCCIQKSSSAELQEAITSMFKWYRKAFKCYVYLADVSTSEHDTDERRQSAFQNSRWFTRGWTLQELLAPKSVEFFSQEGELLGDKKKLERQIQNATGIPTAALHEARMSDFPADERMRWAEHRQTRRKEDKAYSLLGIFDVFMYLNYGEGDNAFERLKAEIGKSLGYHPSEPLTHMPFDAMGGFVGRTTELETLKQQLLDPNGRRIVSLFGLGGIGKSRLASEVAYQIKSNDASYSIFWIQASQLSTLERDMLEIGKKLKIPGIEDEKADVKTLVKQRLSNSQRKWLLVLDNADDEALWARQADPTQQELSLLKHLPRTTNGCILVTTRSRHVANVLTGKEMINIGPLSLEHASKMFMNGLQSPDLAADHTKLLILLDKLAYLPLAIVQAASFVNMTATPVHTYLDLLDQPEADVIKLLSEDFGDFSRYSDATNPIATTWLISFKQIQEYHPLAASLLSSAACLHEKEIPLSLISEAGSKIDIVKAIAVLTGYSFLAKHTGQQIVPYSEEMYDMHRIVRLSARNWLKMEGEFSDWLKICTVRLAQLFPTRHHEHKSIWTTYIPHAQRLCEENDAQNIPERYDLLEKMGLCFMVDGKYDDAVRAHTLVVRWRENKLGTSNQLTLQAYNSLGEALNWMGDWSTAVKYLQQACDGQKAELGAEHPSTLTSMANLASALRDQGHWIQAEELEVQVMETWKRVLGVEHPSTLTSMAHLASTYWNQGRWTQAEELEVQVIETRKRVLGAEHPDTQIGMANLASTYRSQGRWTQAEELDVQVMETRKRMLGPEHPSTLTSMGNLALTYWHQGRWTQAEELEVQVIELRKRVLGAEHPSTLISMGNLAQTYKTLHRDDEAVALMFSSLKLCMKVLGSSHPDTQNVAYTLTKWLNAVDDTDEQAPKRATQMPGAWFD